MALWMLGSPPMPASPGKMRYGARPAVAPSARATLGAAREVPTYHTRRLPVWVPPAGTPRAGVTPEPGLAAGRGEPWILWHGGAPGLVGKDPYPQVNTPGSRPGPDPLGSRGRTHPHLVAGDPHFPDAEPGSSCQSSRAPMPGAGAVPLAVSLGRNEPVGPRS